MHTCACKHCIVCCGGQHWRSDIQDSPTCGLLATHGRGWGQLVRAPSLRGIQLGLSCCCLLLILALPAHWLPAPRLLCQTNPSQPEQGEFRLRNECGHSLFRSPSCAELINTNSSCCYWVPTVYQAQSSLVTGYLLTRSEWHSPWLGIWCARKGRLGGGGEVVVGGMSCLSEIPATLGFWEGRRWATCCKSPSALGSQCPHLSKVWE